MRIAATPKIAAFLIPVLALLCLLPDIAFMHWHAWSAWAGLLAGVGMATGFLLNAAALLLFRDGKLVKQMVGGMSASELDAWVTKEP